MKDKPTIPEIGTAKLNPVPFKFLSTTTGPKWVALDRPAGEDPKLLADHEATRQRFERQLTDVLLAENLVILTGLGTSMCVKGDDGKPLAPTMQNLWDASKAKAGADFDTVKLKVNYTEATENIEFLLSRCQMAEKLKSDRGIL